MLPSIIIRIMLIIGYCFFGYNMLYIISYKRKNKPLKQNIQNYNSNHLENPRLIAKIGVMIANVFLIICCLNIFFYEIISSLIPRFNFYALNGVFQVIGFCLVIGGNITLYFGYHKLRENWTYPLDGIKKKNLVTTGIYSKIRHPVYLSFIMFSVGFELILLDVILIFLLIFELIGLYIQAKDEERGLLKYFGKEYQKYIDKTGRFFYFKRSRIKKVVLNLKLLNKSNSKRSE